MKKKLIFIIISFALLIIGCDSDASSNATQDQTNLIKKITLKTFSLTPESNTKRIQYYLNNQVIADTTFNHLDQWISRNVITTNGNATSYQTFDNSNILTYQQNVTYDALGRLIERRDILPSNNFKTYTYNSNDNSVSVTTTFLNEPNSPTFFLSKFHYHPNGLLFKQTFAPNSTNEHSITFDNFKPLSFQNVESPNLNLNYNFYTNPMPANILKSILEMNNLTLRNLSLNNINFYCNYYPLLENVTNSNTSTTYQTTFNNLNYITNKIRTQVNLNNNSSFVEEELYFYN
jgi:hypothetical protein